jgi:hypothetical protein
MGDSGLRSNEASNALRENLSVAVVTPGAPAKNSAKGSSRLSPKSATSDVSPGQPVTVWALAVAGKRRKQRTGSASAAAVAALRAHWKDREKDFDAPSAVGR